MVPGLFDGPDLGFCEGLACVWKEKFGFINQKGESQIPYKFQLAEHCSEGLAVVRTVENTSGPFGFLNKQGGRRRRAVYPRVFVRRKFGTRGRRDMGL